MDPFSLYTIGGALSYVTAGLIKEDVQNGAIRAYRDAQGYNKERQQELVELWCHSGRFACYTWPELRKSSLELFDVDAQAVLIDTKVHGEQWGQEQCKKAIKRVALREGWKYYDLEEEFHDYKFNCYVYGTQKANQMMTAAERAQEERTRERLKAEFPDAYERFLQEERKQTFGDAIAWFFRCSWYVWVLGLIYAMIVLGG